MHIFRCSITSIGLALFSTLAHAQCDMATFGAHPQPPSPLIAPEVQDQYAKFQWGSDAYTLNDYWWSWNFVKNDAPSASLTLDWKKAGITIPTANPLPPGGVSCRKRLLGGRTQSTPVLDRDAPITYSVNNQVQDAAIFVTEIPTKTAEVPAMDTFETSYRMANGELLAVRVEIGSRMYPGGQFGLSVSVEPKSLIFAISNVTSLWDEDQLGFIFSQFKEQGFSPALVPLAKLLRADTFDGLHLSREVIFQEALVLRGGYKASIRYPGRKDVGLLGTQDAAGQRRDALLVLIDENERPIASETINIVAPSITSPAK